MDCVRAKSRERVAALRATGASGGSKPLASEPTDPATVARGGDNSDAPKDDSAAKQATRQAAGGAASSAVVSGAAASGISLRCCTKCSRTQLLQEFAWINSQNRWVFSLNTEMSMLLPVVWLVQEMT